MEDIHVQNLSEKLNCIVISEWFDLILSKSCCKRIEVMWCTFIYVWV